MIMDDLIYQFQEAKNLGRHLDFIDRKDFEPPNLDNTFYLLDIGRGEKIFIKSGVPFLLPLYSNEYHTKRKSNGTERLVQEPCARLFNSFEMYTDPDESICIDEQIAFTHIDDLVRIFMLNGIDPIKGFENTKAYLQSRNLLSRNGHKLAALVRKFDTMKEEIGKICKARQLSVLNDIQFDHLYYTTRIKLCQQ